MRESIKKQFHIIWQDMGVMYIVALISWIVGFVVMNLIIRSDDSISSFVAVGTIMATFISGFYSIVMVGSTFTALFNIEVSMGCTRKKFFVSFFSNIYASYILLIAEVCILYYIEKTLLAVLHPTLNNKDIMFSMPYLIGILAVLPMLGGLGSLLVMKYGRKAGVPLWCFWMLLCLSPSQISIAMDEHPDSFLGKIGFAMTRLFSDMDLPVFVEMGIMIVIAALMGIVSYCLLSKQQVE